MFGGIVTVKSYFRMEKSKQPTLDGFCDLQRQLLVLEHESELEESTELLKTETPQDLQSRGLALLGLVFSHVSSGLFGKTIVTFAHHLANSKKYQDICLAPSTLSSGDIVGVFPTDSLKSEPIVTGVVHAIDRTSIKVVLDDEDDAPKLWNFSRFSIARIGNNVTHSRLMKAVNDLEKSTHPLTSFLFGNEGRELGEDPTKLELKCEAALKLNQPQQDAVRSALTNRLVTVVQGPPGTGKTTTLAAFIQESVRRDPSIKILACAPSNVAVDNLAARVLKLGLNSIVRVGHPTRVSDDLLAHCLDALVDKSDFAASCIEIKKEIQAILDSRRGYAGLKPLRKELREREAKTIEEIFRQSNVVFTTCNGAFNLDRKLGIKSGGSTPLFDLCVIDECAQALEMSCWIPILQSKRCVLGGDHKQLAATIHSKDAERRGLGKTLFERCFERFHNVSGVDNVLTIQYRMNEVIMDWSNKQFYNGVLQADASVADITLLVPENENCTVNGIDMKSIIESPFVFCDTVGVEGMEEDVSESTASKSNTGELGIVQTYVNLIHKPGITDDICIVSPYLKQTELIRNALGEKHKSIEVSTVDSFQGREGEVIIISLVRSNPSNVVGFLADFRRLNVAVTRAKKHVFIVGDSETISSDKTLKSLYDYACDYGMLISAQSFVSE